MLVLLLFVNPVAADIGTTPSMYVLITEPQDGATVSQTFALSWDVVLRNVVIVPEFVFCNVYVDGNLVSFVPCEINFPEARGRCSTDVNLDSEGWHDVAVTCSYPPDLEGTDEINVFYGKEEINNEENTESNEEDKLPNLTVSAQARIIGSESLIEYSVCNVGEANAQKSVLCVFVNGTKWRCFDVLPLQPSECQSGRVTISFEEAGIYFIRFFADYYNEVKESNEQDNTYVVVLKVPPIPPPPPPPPELPNLTVSISATAEGKDVNICTTVYNESEVAAPENTLAILIDSELAETVEVPSIAPEGNITKCVMKTLAVGTHVITAIADYYNEVPETNEQDNERSVTVEIKDTTPPTITSFAVYPDSGDTSTLFTIYCAARDSDSGILRLDIYVDGQLKNTCYYEQSCTYTSKFAAGTHYTYCKATDNAGNVAASETKTFTVSPISDTVPPSVMIRAPAENTVYYVPADVNVVFDAKDNVLLSYVAIDCESDGSPEKVIEVKADQYSGAYVCHYDVSGTYLITVSAKDAAGNMDEDTVSIKVIGIIPPEKLPNLVVSGKQNAVAYGGTTIEYNVCNVGEGDAGTSTLAVFVDNSLNKTVAIPSLPAGACDVGEILLALAAGTHQVKLVADYYNTVSESNENDNVYTFTVSVQVPPVEPDFYVADVNAAPVDSGVELNAEICNAGQEGGNATVKLCLGTACEEENVYVQGGDCNLVSALLPKDSNLTISVEILTPDANTQNNSWTLACVDADDADAAELCCLLRGGVYGYGHCCGDEGDEELPGTEPYFYDWYACKYDYPPKITVVYPPLLATVHSPFTLRIDVEDEGDVDCNIAIADRKWTFEGPGEFSETVSFAPGTYSGSVVCVDERDQMASQTIKFTVVTVSSGGGGVYVASEVGEESEEQTQTTVPAPTPTTTAPEEEIPQPKPPKYYIDLATGVAVTNPQDGVYYDPVWDIIVLFTNGQALSLGGGTATVVSNAKALYIVSTWREYNLFSGWLVPPGSIYYADGGDIYIGVDLDGDSKEDFAIILKDVRISDELNVWIDKRDGLYIPRVLGFEGEAYLVAPNGVCVREEAGRCVEWKYGEVPLTGFAAIQFGEEGSNIAAIIGALIVVLFAVYGIYQTYRGRSVKA